MRRQLGSSFGRDEHIPVRIAEKSTAGIGTARSIVVVQSEHADEDHVVAVVCQYEPPDRRQGTNSLRRHLDQTILIHRITGCPVVRLILAKSSAQRYQVSAK